MKKLWMIALSLGFVLLLFACGAGVSANIPRQPVNDLTNAAADEMADDFMKMQPKSIRVLFIGTSHTYYNDMVKMFKDIGEANNKNIAVTMLSEGGAPLSKHCDQPDTRFNILYGDYDYIVLQNAAHPFWEWELYEGLEAITEFTDQTDAKLILFMTWPEKHLLDDYADSYAKFYEAAETIDAAVAPVGEYFLAFLSDYPDYELYNKDNAHASPLGSFVASRVIYETIFGDLKALTCEDILADCPSD